MEGQSLAAKSSRHGFYMQTFGSIKEPVETSRLRRAGLHALTTAAAAALGARSTILKVAQRQRRPAVVHVMSSTAVTLIDLQQQPSRLPFAGCFPVTSDQVFQLVVVRTKPWSSFVKCLDELPTPRDCAAVLGRVQVLRPFGRLRRPGPDLRAAAESHLSSAA